MSHATKPYGLPLNPRSSALQIKIKLISVNRVRDKETYNCPDQENKINQNR